MDQTTPADVAEIIEGALEELLHHLDRAPACAEVRALHTEAATLRHAVDGWKLRRPDRSRLAATYDLLAQLSERAQRFVHRASGVDLGPRQRPTIPEIPAARVTHGHR